MLDAANGHITVLSGGFPCQPVSGAGKRLGSNDERWMWNDYARIIRETQPDWIIIENSPRLFIIPEWRGVQSDLETAGYEIQAFRVPASGVGAPHIRERAVVVANTCRVSAAQSHQKENPVRDERRTRQNVSWGTWNNVSLPDWKIYPSRICRMDDGFSRKMDRHRMLSLGNAVLPQVFFPFFRAIRELSGDVIDL